MNRITLEIPDELSAFLAGSGQDLTRAAIEAIALEGYREQKVSSGQLRRLLGFGTRMQVHAFLKARGIPVQFDATDLEQDRAAGDRLVPHSDT